ncbi:MAG: hypothetical protein ABSG71_06025 [Thermodesulfobacteriota bacterium]|jgi:hypothetical protein
MKKGSNESVITITEASTDEIDKFIKRDMWREEKSEKRWDKRTRPIDAEKLMADVINPSVNGPYRVFFEKTEGKKSNWREFDVGVNPMAEIDDILSEPFNDPDRAKCVMVICGTSTIDVYMIHPANKEGTLDDYKRRVWELTKEKTLESNREGLVKTFGKGFDDLLEMTFENEGKIPTPGELARSCNISFPTAQKRIENYKKQVKKVGKSLKKN